LRPARWLAARRVGSNTGSSAKEKRRGGDKGNRYR
jgi:hypothetical protein